MKKIYKPLAAAILALAICLPVMADTKRNLVKEAGELRAQGIELEAQGNPTAAFQAYSQCADILMLPEYTNANKSLVTQSVCNGFGMLQSSFFRKRDFASAEKVLRKKVQIMEVLKQTDNNEYQGTLRMLDTSLRAQNKSTDQSITAKFKDLTEGADKPFAAPPNQPAPPASDSKD